MRHEIVNSAINKLLISRGRSDLLQADQHTVNSWVEGLVKEMGNRVNVEVDGWVVSFIGDPNAMSGWMSQPAVFVSEAQRQIYVTAPPVYGSCAVG